MTTVFHEPGGASQGVVIVDPISGQPTDTTATQQILEPSDETFLGTIQSTGTILKQYIGDWKSFVLEFSATAGSHSIIVEGNSTGLDADQWYATSGSPADLAAAGMIATRPVTTGYSVYIYAKRFPWIRVRCSAHGGGGATVTARVTLSNNPVSSNTYVQTITGMANNNNAANQAGQPYFVTVGGITRPTNAILDISGLSTALTFNSGTQLLTIPYSVSEATWGYSCPVGGIANSTTAVVIKTAAGSGVRNYLNSLVISTDTLGAATEFVVLDGSTAIHRFKLQTTALPVQNIIFPVPLRGTANTSMSIQTVTAVTGGVYCCANGYSAP